MASRRVADLPVEYSDGSLPGLYSDVENPNVFTEEELQDEEWKKFHRKRAARDQKKLSMASGGSDSLYGRHARHLKVKEKEKARQRDLGDEGRSDDQEEEEDVSETESSPPAPTDSDSMHIFSDIERKRRDLQNCIAFFHNGTNFELRLNEESVDSSEGEIAGGEGGASRQELDEIPRVIHPHETKRFKFKHEIIYDIWDPKERKKVEVPLMSSSSPNGSETAKIHIWAQTEDTSGGTSAAATASNPPRVSFNSSSHLPESIRMIIRRGNELEHLNPVLSVFLLPAGATRAKIPEEILKFLIEKTYFDYWELEELWLRWYSLTDGRSIRRERFVHFFPELDDEDVINSVFHAFDALSTQNMEISFEEFVIGLSVMTRGDSIERAALAYEIFDLNNDGKVTRTEALRLAKATSGALSAHGMAPSDYGDPEKAINCIFLKRSETLDRAIVSTPDMARRKFIGRHASYVVDEDNPVSSDESKKGQFAPESFMHDELEKNIFLERAQHEPDLLDAFGLFDFFHWRFLQEIETEHAREHNIMPFGPHEGKLKRIPANFLERLTTWRRHAYFWIRNGFICWNYTSSLTGGGNTPEKSDDGEALWDAKVKCVWPHRNRFKITIGRKHKELIFEADSKEQARRWLITIRANRRRPNRFRSFAPIRDHVYAKWFVNAQDYFEEVVDALDRAKSRVYITAWAIAPELYLRRKTPLDTNDRLDHVIKRTADRGVKVYILFYDAPNFLNLESDWVYRVLNRLGKNVIAIRHPSAISDMIWSHHQKSIIIDESLAFIGGIDLTYWRFDNRKYQIADPDGEMWPGKDYGNLFLHAEVNGPLRPDVIKRSDEPRMPWHDISIMMVGWTALDAASNFIQRWNHTIRTGIAPRRAHALLPLRLSQPTGRGLASDVTNEFKVARDFAESRGGHDHLSAQVTRSAARWSTGVAFPERSIYKAYVDLISKSEHFIFIENQFFITAIDRGSPKNRVLEALFLRLCRAIAAHETFRLIVVIPVWPGGSLTEGSNRFMTKYTYRSISREGHSLLEKLAEKFPGVDLSNYVYFFTLRQRARVGDILLTESIYIHAKIMIVDDRHLIVGSANINDRSMLGTRDSEIATVLSATDIDTVMNGKPFKASKFVQSLRIDIWADFLEMDQRAAQIKLRDPISDAVYRNMLIASAQQNSALYVSVFDHMPDNTFMLSSYKRSKVDLSDANNKQKLEQLNQVKGVLVNFPMDFLKDEIITIGFFDKERFVPRVTFL